MIYLDNIIFHLQGAGGISSVWKNLIENLLIMTDHVKLLEFDAPNFNIFRSNLPISRERVQTQRHFSPILSQFSHPTIEEEKPFIFHSSYFRTCKNPHAINVTTVHDFIYEQGKPTLKQKVRIKLNYRAIRNSEAIVCISENTKKDLFKYLPDIDPQKVYVIHNGVSEDYKILDIKDTYSHYRDFVLFVGGRHGYKNFEFVVDALKDSEFNLLVCGSPLSDKETYLLENSLPNRYKNIIYPSNQELNKIYNSVFALAYPSSYEGFGIPILEAQRAGCPVIALNASSIPEVIGDTPLLMNHLSKEEFHEKLELLKEEKIRQEIIETDLVNSKRFSWEKMAKEYYALYNKLLKDQHSN